MEKIKIGELERLEAEARAVTPLPVTRHSIVEEADWKLMMPARNALPALLRLARAAKEVLRVTDAVAAEDMYMHPTEEDEALREALSAFDFTD